MLVALKVAPHGVTLADLEYAAQACDANERVHSFWLNDHLVAPFDPAQPVWEAWTILAAMSGWTTRVRLGVMVSPIALRPAPLFGKMAVTVDHLSNGRLEVGLGFGSNTREHEWARIPQPRPDADLIISYCSVLDDIWNGRGVMADGAAAAPQAVQERLPLWIGGRSRAAIEAVVRLGAGWNLQSLHDEAGFARFQQLAVHQPIGVPRPLMSAQTAYRNPVELREDYRKGSKIGLDMLVINIMHDVVRRHVEDALAALDGC